MPLAAQTSGAAGAIAETELTDVVKLPEFVLSADRVANKSPAATFSAPVSYLRFEPQVDLQTRNFGEAQGDISIRGGIFEGTNVQVGGMSVVDPQTGHYTAELPIPTAMLAEPVVRVGAAHAFESLQATVGSVAYAWDLIEDRGEAAAAWGNGDLNRQSIYAGSVVRDGADGAGRIGVDASWARSEASGTIRNGDHKFERVAGRVQYQSELGRTELFGGYQAKFFGWPNLYTPFGVAETENLQTTLLMLHHRQQFGAATLEAGVHYRRNRDDYEFDRYRPGLFNPYQHETDVSAAYAHYRTALGAWRVDLRGEAAADALESTALLFGRFMSRSYAKLGATAGRSFDVDGGVLSTRLGATWDDSNRDGSAVSPLVELAWIPHARWATAVPRLYAEYSGATRVPGYTALNSNPSAGLFRGNSGLGREKSRNAEVGAELRGDSWSLRAAAFLRRDGPMVDWTYTAGAPNARTAREVEIDTAGVEVLGSRAFGAVDLVASYAFLEKDADYGSASVDASFYALNFPTHRVTVALIARLGAGFELRCDNEYRVQEENRLRTIGGDEAFLTSVGLAWAPPSYEAVELSILVDNLWDDDFQELPAVPAAGRQITFGVAYRW